MRLTRTNFRKCMKLRKSVNLTVGGVWITSKCGGSVGVLVLSPGSVTTHVLPGADPCRDGVAVVNPSKHETFTRCWVHVGPSSSTLAQHPIRGIGPDGSFDPFVARKSEILGSNPGRVGYLSSRLYVCSAANCSKDWSVQCCLWSFDKSSSNSGNAQQPNVFTHCWFKVSTPSATLVQ